MGAIQEAGLRRKNARLYKQVGDLRAEVKALQTSLNACLCFTLAENLVIMADAIDHLHQIHNCDHHGYEVVAFAAQHARKTAETINKLKRADKKAGE